MARNVYYDPFGQRTDGYRMGVQDEVGLQDQTRRARASDWDMDNMAPLRLNQAQRNDAMGQFAVPYLQNQYGIDQRRNLAGLYPMEQRNFEGIGQATGNYAPALTNASIYGSGQQANLQQPEMFAPMNRQMFDMFQQNQGNMQGPGVETPEYLQQLYQQYGVSPQQYQQYQGGLSFNAGPQAEQGYDQYLGYDRMRQANVDQRMLYNDQWNRQVQQQQLQVGQQNADQLGNYYQATGGARQQAAQTAAGVGAYDGSADGF